MPKSPPQLIAKLWTSYQWDVLGPSGAPSVQLQECRRAFYAGARGLLSALSEILDGDCEPTDRELEGIHRELEAFAAAMAAGRN